MIHLLPMLYFVLLFSPLFPLALFFSATVNAIPHDKSPFLQGRYSLWFRNLGIWKQFAAYFPSQVICDAPLEDKQYLFTYAPHGFQVLGVFCTMCTNGNNFTNFYKRPVHPITIDFLFTLPIVRHFYSLLGYLSCSKQTMVYNIKNGESLVLVLGGAQEVVYFDKYNINIIVRKRIGFFKMALEYGVDIVPVFTFGEHDIHKMVEFTNPWFKWIQTSIKDKFGLSLQPFHGVFGLLPYREPLNTIVGKPIKVKLTKTPTIAQIQELQVVYITELKRMFDKYQPRYGAHVKSLNIVE